METNRKIIRKHGPLCLLCGDTVIVACRMQNRIRYSKLSQTQKGSSMVMAKICAFAFAIHDAAGKQVWLKNAHADWLFRFRSKINYQPFAL